MGQGRVEEEHRTPRPPKGARPLVWIVLTTVILSTFAAGSSSLFSNSHAPSAAPTVRATLPGSSFHRGPVSPAADQVRSRTSLPDAAGGARWFNLTPRLNPSPQGRLATSMTYDAKDGYVLLFSGETAAGVGLPDTWAYRHGNWTQLFPPTSPTPRIAPVLVYDPVDQYVVLFGGIVVASGETVADTWTFAGGLWTNITNNVHPSARAEASASWDNADQSLILFGGVNVTASIFSDTWRFIGGTWTELFPAAPPSPRAGSGLTYDAADGYLLLFGGVNLTANFSDTWRFTNGSWSEMFPAVAPAARALWSMAYDPELSEVVLFGGGTGDDKIFFGDSWSFHGGGWTQQFPTSTPGQREFAQMAWDPVDGYLVLASGASSFTPVTLVPETWAYAVAPSVALISPPNSVDINQPVTWSASTSGGVAPYTVSWSFGDGSTANGSVTSHPYGAPGTYQVNVTVVDWVGQTAAVNHTVIVAPHLAISLAVQPTTAPVGAPFNLSETVTGGSPPVTFAWTLGDGRTLAGAGPFERNYSAAGPYEIVLTATDSAGASKTSSVNITVTAPPTPAPSSSSTGYGGWLPIAVLSVIVVAVVVNAWFILRRRRRSAGAGSYPPQPSTPPNIGPTSPPAPPPGSTPPQ